MTHVRPCLSAIWRAVFCILAAAIVSCPVSLSAEEALVSDYEQFLVGFVMPDSPDADGDGDVDEDDFAMLDYLMDEIAFEVEMDQD